jgi:hypothetical protein
MSMSWLCKIRHNWSYSTEKINIGKLGSDAHITLNMRLCKRCYKKQRQELNGEIWFDVSLNKEEIREIRLKELGL